MLYPFSIASLKQCRRDGEEKKGNLSFQISGVIQAVGKTPAMTDKTRRAVLQPQQGKNHSLSDHAGGEESCDYLMVYVPCPPC